MSTLSATPSDRVARVLWFQLARDRVSVGTLVLAMAMSALSVQPAEAQQTITDVLTFLMTNRSIPTDDFVRDEEAVGSPGTELEFAL